MAITPASSPPAPTSGSIDLQPWSPIRTYQNPGNVAPHIFLCDRGTRGPHTHSINCHDTQATACGPVVPGSGASQHRPFAGRLATATDDRLLRAHRICACFYSVPWGDVAVEGEGESASATATKGSRRFAAG